MIFHLLYIGGDPPKILTAYCINENNTLQVTYWTNIVDIVNIIVIAKNNKTGIESSVVARWNERRVSITVEQQGAYYVTVVVFDTCRQNYNSQTVPANNCSSVDHSTINVQSYMPSIIPTPRFTDVSSGLFSLVSPEPSLQCVEKENNRGNKYYNCGIIYFWYNNIEADVIALGTTLAVLIACMVVIVLVAVIVDLWCLKNSFIRGIYMTVHV